MAEVKIPWGGVEGGDYLSVTPAGGSNDGVVAIESTMNITPSDRSMEVVLKGSKGDARATVSVSQPSGYQAEKTVTVTENGTTEVLPDDGKLAMGKVNVIAEFAAQAGGVPLYTLVMGSRSAAEDPDPGWYNSEGVKMSTEEVTAMLDSLTAFTEARECLRPLIYRWDFDHERWPVDMGLAVYPPTLCVKVVRAQSIDASHLPESLRIGEELYVQGLGLYFLNSVSSTSTNSFVPLQLYKTAQGYVDLGSVIDPTVYKDYRLPTLQFAAPDRKLFVDATRLAVGVDITTITCLSTGERLYSFIREYEKGYPVFVGTGWHSNGRLDYPSDAIVWLRKSSASVSYPNEVGLKYVTDDGTWVTVLVGSNGKVTSITTA